MANVITQMGGQIFAGDQLKTSIWAWNGGQVGICSLNWRCLNVTGTLPRFGEFAKQLADVFIGQNILAMFSATTLFLGVKVSDIGNPVKKLSGICSNGAPGTDAGFTMPGQVSGILSWKTNFAGQKYRGRSYFPFPTDTFFDPGIPGPTNAYLNKIDGIANGWSHLLNVTTTGGSADGVPVIFHPGPPPTYDPIISWRSPQRFATQRRRGEYGAQNPPVITG